MNVIVNFIGSRAAKHKENAAMSYAESDEEDDREGSQTTVCKGRIGGVPYPE